jgi:hypothetical protein
MIKNQTYKNILSNRQEMKTQKKQFISLIRNDETMHNEVIIRGKQKSLHWANATIKRVFDEFFRYNDHEDFISIDIR